jgi:hypothetical protein
MVGMQLIDCIIYLYVVYVVTLQVALYSAERQEDL